MGAGTFYPAVGADDGFWQPGFFDGASFNLRFGDIGGGAYHSFIRFPSVNIPQGNTIDSAFVRFISNENRSGTTVDVNIYFNDVDNAVAPTDFTEAGNLSLTTNLANWSPGAWTDGSQEDTPSIISALQEVINRVGWSSGNALQLVIKNNGSSVSAFRDPSAIEQSSGAEKAELHVTWSEPSIEGEITDGAGNSDAIIVERSFLAEIATSAGMSDTDAVEQVLLAGVEESAGISDTYELDTPYRDIIEGVGTSDTYLTEIDSLILFITENFGTDDSITGVLDALASVTNNAGISDVIHGGVDIFLAITNNAGISDAYEKIKETLVSIEDGSGTTDEYVIGRLYPKLISEIINSWDTIKWAWHKKAVDSFAITGTAEKILGIPVKEWLALTDNQSNTWKGSEIASDSLSFIGVLNVARIYQRAIADGLGASAALSAALCVAITDILTFTETTIGIWAGKAETSESFRVADTADAIRVYEGLLAAGVSVNDAFGAILCLIITDELETVDALQNIGVFQHLIEDGMTFEDIIKRIFPKLVADSFSFTAGEITTLNLVSFLELSAGVGIIESTVPVLAINKAISDALEVMDIASIKQLLQELIQDGLNIEIVVEIDGELYECWVVNTGEFHVSVYSGYDYNSFALMNNTVYGCKSDGIYEMEGDTDDGSEFHSGIVLPETRFGSEHNKRFRKAFFGVSGDNLTMKMQTESGDRTFIVVDSEMTITRDLKGRKWKISLEDFDSLDSINLFPTILTRR